VEASQVKNSSKGVRTPSLPAVDNPAPPELEERSLWVSVEQDPENTQIVLSLIACLLRQGKPVPPELEERALWVSVEQDPENTRPC
jgi:hypothetical protein